MMCKLERHAVCRLYDYRPFSGNFELEYKAIAHLYMRINSFKFSREKYSIVLYYRFACKLSIYTKGF